MEPINPGALVEILDGADDSNPTPYVGYYGVALNSGPLLYEVQLSNGQILIYHDIELEVIG